MVKKILVQGIGNVGMHLVEHLTKEGAKVYVNDISEARIKTAVDNFKAEFVEADKMFDLDIDIYAPCALGATVNDDTLSKLKCKIICGAANNQLAEEKKARRFSFAKGYYLRSRFCCKRRWHY